MLEHDIGSMDLQVFQEVPSYHPVSLTRIFAKTMEGTFNTRLNWYTET
jgi:hypothetical protein